MGVSPMLNRTNHGRDARATSRKAQGEGGYRGGAVGVGGRSLRKLAIRQSADKVSKFIRLRRIDNLASLLRVET